MQNHNDADKNEDKSSKLAKLFDISETSITNIKKSYQENGIDCTKEQLREYALAKAAESGELSAEEFEAFVKEKECGSRELSDEELDNVAGGCAGPYQSGDTPLFNSGDRVKYRKKIRYANCGDFGFNEYENRVDTIFDYCKEDGVFIYRMRCGDLIKEYDVMEKA